MTRTRRRLLAALLSPFLIAATLVALAAPAGAVPVSNIAVTSNFPASVTGQSVTLVTTITGTGTTPTGTVTFFDGATPLCSGVTVVEPVVGVGSANCATATLTVGTHSITGVYSGDGTYDPVTSPPFTQTVAASTTTTGVVSSINPSVFTGPVTITATVAPVLPGTGTPTGTVSFQDATVDITGCTSQTMSGGVATCVLSSLAVASHSITARYAGTTSYTTSLSSPVVQVVNKTSTTVAVSSNDTSAVWSQSVTFTATVSPVSPASGAPASGLVDFKRGGTAITGCTNRTVAAGLATCTTTTQPLGVGVITADYLGSANYVISSSPSIDETVTVATTAVAPLTSNHNPATAGQSVALQATVSTTAPGTATPTGVVAFFRIRDDMTRQWLGTETLVGGVATISTASLPGGTSNLITVYRGTAELSISSGQLNQTVGHSDTVTTVITSRSPAQADRFIAFTATVDGTALNSGTPTGTVAFFRTKSGSARQWIANVTLVHGVARLKTDSIPVGTHAISGVYRGTSAFEMSTGTTGQTITP